MVLGNSWHLNPNIFEGLAWSKKYTEQYLGIKCYSLMPHIIVPYAEGQITLRHKQIVSLFICRLSSTNPSKSDSVSQKSNSCQTRELICSPIVQPFTATEKQVWSVRYTKGVSWRHVFIVFGNNRLIRLTRERQTRRVSFKCLQI